MTRIWVDTASGTWGEVDGDVGRLLIVDLTEQAAADRAGGFDHDHDEYSLIAALESMSDSEIVQYADKYGRLAVGLPTDEQFRDASLVVEEAFDIGAAGTQGSHSGSGLMLKIAGRLGLVDLPEGLK